VHANRRGGVRGEPHRRWSRAMPAWRGRSGAFSCRAMRGRTADLRAACAAPAVRSADGVFTERALRCLMYI
jgi:hypothetical protein